MSAVITYIGAYIMWGFGIWSVAYDHYDQAASAFGVACFILLLHIASVLRNAAKR